MVLILGALLLIVMGRSWALVSSLLNSSEQPRIAAARVSASGQQGLAEVAALAEEAAEEEEPEEASQPGAPARHVARPEKQSSRDFEPRRSRGPGLDEKVQRDQAGQDARSRRRRPKLPIFDPIKRRRIERLESSRASDEVPPNAEEPPLEEEEPVVDAAALGGAAAED